MEITNTRILNNFEQWGVKNAFEIIDGRLNMPDQPAVGDADEAINQFRSELEAFNKAKVAAQEDSQVT